ncbi:MAG: HAMP domain-containing sensor histidine kinase [Vicinamibacterales bacterium]
MSFGSRKPLTRTLRGRLTLWHLTALAVTLGVFAALMYGAVSRSLYEHHDSALRRQASELAGRLRGRALTEAVLLDAIAVSATTPRFVMIRDARGELLFEEPVLHSNEPNIGHHEALVHAARNNANVPEFFTASLERSGEVRFICVPLGPPDLFLQIGDPLGDLRETLDTVVVASMSLIPIVLLVSAGVGWMVVKGALAPVRAVTATLEEIHATHLSRRVQVHPRDRDLSTLVAALNHLLDRLERAFETLRQFAGDVSHQIQTPLTVIKGAVDVARREPERTSDPAWLDGLDDEVRDIRAIVADLRSLAMADAPVRDAGVVSFSDVVAEAAEIVAALGELREVAVHSDVTPGISVRGDTTRLKQVVLNLGDNAVKYTPAGGHVTIQLESAEPWAILRVTDTGIGISERDLPRLFDRLFRTDSAGQRADGTGLGLAIVKRIVEVHRGTVEVESRPDAGSMFTVRLPLA